MAKDKDKSSITSKPHAAALVTEPGSVLTFYTNTNYLAIQEKKFASSRNLASNDFGDDPGDDPRDDPGDDPEDPPLDPEDPPLDPEGRPKLSDVEVLSNEVVEDPVTKLLSAKIVFKVKNSSGVNLKAINVRVEKK